MDSKIRKILLSKDRRDFRKKKKSKKMDRRLVRKFLMNKIKNLSADPKRDAKMMKARIIDTSGLPEPNEIEKKLGNAFSTTISPQK